MKTFTIDDSTIVSTKAGKLQGYYYDGCYIFKGIHYAEAERFQPPHEVEPWDGVQDATSFGMVCPLMHQDIPNGELMVPHAYWPQSEHCQNLNIWTASLNRESGMPVMVWLHGGGFSAGSAIEQLAYDGRNMAVNGDVVVVTVNHRLNILGYLDLEPFAEKYKNSGNAGQADLVAALQWVHDNIEEFGGNPNNVTIFGQSGGGMKVSALMNTPAADELFQKGFIMSGVMEKGIFGPNEGDGRELVTAMMRALGLGTGDVAQLETIPYPELVDAYEKVSPVIRKKGGYIGQMPLKNEWYPGEPQFDGFTEHAKNVPLLIGSVIGEFAFGKLDFNKYVMTGEEKRARIVKSFGDASDELINEFKKAYPEKDPTDVISFDHIFRAPTKFLTDEKAKHQEAPTYSYVFAYEFPVQNGKPAWHCSDIPFVFGNIDLVPSANVPGTSDKLQEQIFQAVMAFAHTGDPNHAEIPFWPACRDGDEATMIFDRTCTVRHNHDTRLLELYKQASPEFSLFDTDNIQH